MDSEDLQAYSIPELEQICREQKALYTPEELEQIFRIIQEKRSVHKADNQTDMVYCIVILILTMAGFFLPVIRIISLLFHLWLTFCKFPLIFGNSISRETVCAMMSFQFPVIGLAIGIYFKIKQSHFSKYYFSEMICSLMLGMLLLTGGFQF